MHLDVHRGEFTGRGSGPRRRRLGCAAGTENPHQNQQQREAGGGPCPHANRLISPTSGSSVVADTCAPPVRTSRGTSIATIRPRRPYIVDRRSWNARRQPASILDRQPLTQPQLTHIGTCWQDRRCRFSIGSRSERRSRSHGCLAAVLRWMPFGFTAAVVANRCLSYNQTRRTPMTLVRPKSGCDGSTESSDSAVTCARPCFGGSSRVSESTLGSLLLCPGDVPLECPLLVPPCRFEEFEYRNDLIVGENGTERRHSALLQLCTVAGERE